MCIGDQVEIVVVAKKDGGIILREKLKFHKEETDNDSVFVKELSKLDDVYINDAFAVSNRAHATNVGVVELISEKGAGLLLQTETGYFHKSMDEPHRPLMVVVGGANFSSQLGAPVKMLEKVDCRSLAGNDQHIFKVWG